MTFIYIMVQNFNLSDLKGGGGGGGERERERERESVYLVSYRLYDWLEIAVVDWA